MIAREAWLKALEDAGQPTESDEDAITLAEFGAMFNIPPETARHKLTALVRAGKATKTWKRGKREDGRMQFLRAFRLVP